MDILYIIVQLNRTKRDDRTTRNDDEERDLQIGSAEFHWTRRNELKRTHVHFHGLVFRFSDVTDHQLEGRTNVESSRERENDLLVQVPEVRL